ncbi:hypothetical protein [Pelosinus baikalensis]|uniref:Uncharacterized protein n=1 Tax=Pelosinus baikalensis TaxID=2892015 RepID=A0ABS8HTW0_9FIRM|nr:hypothetical protein [Pelosinus baikalensis]MCC5465557.1 hypothetical protein [Pelosinus baikalensis]
MMKKFIFYLSTTMIILGLAWILINSNNEVKSTLAFLVAVFSFFFGPGAFIKLKDWCFGKSSAKLVIKNIEKPFSSLIREKTLQGYSIEVCILNVGQMVVIKRICLDTDKGLFQMQLIGSSDINTGEKITPRHMVNPAKRLKINNIFVEDYYGNKWFMEKAELDNLAQAFENLLDKDAKNGYTIPEDLKNGKKC